MTWIVLAFLIASAIIVARVFVKLRKIRSSKQESWDARIIEQLRSKGYAPFNEYKVDFFLALPDEAACQAVRGTLESEGFSVDAKPMTEKTDLSYSLHAAKSMRLIVPEMQDLTRRMNELATRHQGRYDGWTA
jgi:hypothetical protein